MTNYRFGIAEKAGEAEVQYASPFFFALKQSQNSPDIVRQKMTYKRLILTSKQKYLKIWYI